jgi:hypothetical protein
MDSKDTLKSLYKHINTTCFSNIYIHIYNIKWCNKTYIYPFDHKISSPETYDSNKSLIDELYMVDRSYTLDMKEPDDWIVIKDKNY